METVNPPRDFGGALNRAIDLLGARMTHPPAGGGGGRGGRGGRGGGGGGGGGHVIKVKRLDAVQLHLRCCWSGRNKKKRRPRDWPEGSVGIEKGPRIAK